MRILVDADACPVLDIIEEIAQSYHIELDIFCDMHHALYSEVGMVYQIDQGADAVDFALLKKVKVNDIVVTQDYGLASLVLTKRAKALHPDGRLYTEDTIEEMLFGRYVSKKQRQSKQKVHLRGPKKRTKEDDECFYKQFIHLIETCE